MLDAEYMWHPHEICVIDVPGQTGHVHCAYCKAKIFPIMVVGTNGRVI